MKVLAIVLCLVFAPLNCFALQNPGDAIMDDAINKMKVSTHEIKNEITKSVKEFVITALSLLLEVFAVVAIGWLFTFMVDGKTAKMIKLTVVVCGITSLIRVVTRLFE